MSTETTETTEIIANGLFMQSLTRNNKKIKSDRAKAIEEDSSLIFKRKIEDMKMEQRKLIRARDGMLDLSPTDTNSLILAREFNAEEFVKQEIEFLVKERQLSLTIELCEKRYAELFGEMA